MGAKLSAFADEVYEDFREQVSFLVGEGVKFIELRFIDKQNIMNLSKGKLNVARTILNDNGIKVSAIGSPIGKVNLSDGFQPHLNLFKHAVELAEFFETPFIRMFSYYPPEGKNIEDSRQVVMARMRRKIEILEGKKVTMVHENEARIYGHSAKNCADLATELDKKKFRLCYDPANFVWGEKIGNNVEVCWPLMKPYVVHIHIKDWKLGATIGSIPGEGDGQIRELLTELAAMNYDGFMTMEPHLQEGGQFGGSTGPELFSKAIAAVRKIAKEVGLDLH